jgi:iron complex outermembrane receptor protein
VNSFSQEIRITSRNSGALGWLAGLYYGRESVHATVQFHFFDGYPGTFAPPGATAPLYGFDEYNDFDQIKTSKAVFVNAHFDVTPTVTLRAGARLTRDDVSVNNFFALEGGLTSASTGFAPDGGTTLWTQTIPLPAAPYSQFSTALTPQAGVNPALTQKNDNVSTRAGVDWKPADGLLAYFSFSQGYRGAAFNGQAFNAPAELNFAAPEKLNAYELGLKSQWWNHRAEFNVAAFHYDYRNQQFLDAFALPGGTGGSGFHTVNAPKSRVDGAEFELRAKLNDDLQLTAGLGLLKSKYVELSLHNVDLSGNHLIQAPAYNGSVAVDWQFAHIWSGEFRLLVDANFYGKQYFDAPNTQRIAQGAYGVANSRVSFESGSKPGFAAGAWIKNIANREYLAYGLAQRDPSQGGLGFDYALVGEPRTFGLDVTYRF